VQNQAAYDLYEESLHGEYKEEFRKSAINFIVSMLPPDLRADKAHLVTRDSEGYLGTDSTPGGAVGGSLIQPILAPMIWRAIINATQTRKISWVLDAPQDIKIPTEQSIGSGGDVAEGGAFVYDDTVFGSESLSPVKHTAGQKYTIEFLQDVEYNFPAITQLILTNLGTRIGIVEEMDFLTYLAGALGPSGNGISTTGVIGTDGVENTGAVTADDITNLYCSIPQIIRGTSIWMLADSILGQVSRLREAGHYMFFPMQKAGMLDATIDVIKGRPVVWNAYLAPAPAAAGGRVGYFGEFNQRLIVGQRSGLQIRPLLEKYLDSEGKIAIIGWLRSACVLTHKNAINYLKLASGYVS
jgi:HK97 family phage major capsid protein